MSKTVCVFGGGGKIGRRAVETLLTQGYQVRALVHRTPIDDERVVGIAGSVTDAKAVEEAVRGAQMVVQMATAKEDPETFFDVSLKGTFHILEACRNQGVEQFLLLGGDAALGIWMYPQSDPIDESHPLTAYPGYYAFSKVLEEAMTQQYHVQYGLPFTVLRSSWVFEGRDLLDHFSIVKNVGPVEKGHGFGEVSAEVRELARAGQERIPVLLDVESRPLKRHLVHIDDVMQAFRLMIGNPAALGEVFNIAAAEPIDYREAGEYLSKLTGIPTVEIPCPDYHSFRIDIGKARRVLGYAPENDIFRIADRAVEVAQLASQ